MKKNILKKIIIFYPSFERGGVEIILVNLINYFLKKNTNCFNHLKFKKGKFKNKLFKYRTIKFKPICLFGQDQ